LLALGGLQGAIGWWMVASGLVDRPDVSHIRLAVHLMAALFIFAGLIWTALDLKALARDPAAQPARMPTPAIWALSLLALQIMFGAYVAGLDAGYAYASWPKMGDQWFPADTPMLAPFLRNLADNPIVVQFIHRWLAFVVALAIYMLGFKALDKGVKRPGVAVIVAVSLQILLGIATLLSGVAIEIAVAHQAMAALLLASVVTAAHGLGRRAA
jgi:cytochrome c oxidase assembly protein subunit 15